MDPQYEALALLIVRLENDRPRSGGLCWHRWNESPGAKPHGLPEDVRRSSTRERPFKNLPEAGAWHYFDKHVEQLLFPPRDSRGSRWVCCPNDLWLDLREVAGGPARRTRIDLLERVTTPLDPRQTFGLIHLSLLPTAENGAPDTLKWGEAVSATFNHGRQKFELTLIDGDRTTKVSSGRPVRTLAEELFGDPDSSLERDFYSVYMAQYPAALRDDPAGQREWRRALSQHRGEMQTQNQNGSDREREERQTLQMRGGATALMLGRGAAFSLRTPIGSSYARSFRSYWAESIFLGLMQQYALEEFQQRLADFGDRLSPEIGHLRQDWLKFRNVLWWSQLSRSAEIPQELMSRLRSELGTERLFTDLEGDLAVYSEHQHQEGLANLQIYGSAIVAFGPLATIIGLIGASGCLLALLLAGSVVFALCVMVVVRVQLKGPPTWWAKKPRLHGEGGIRTHEAG